MRLRIIGLVVTLVLGVLRSPGSGPPLDDFRRRERTGRPARLTGRRVRSLAEHLSIALGDAAAWLITAVTVIGAVGIALGIVATIVLNVVGAQKGVLLGVASIFAVAAGPAFGLVGGFWAGLSAVSVALLGLWLVSSKGLVLALFVAGVAAGVMGGCVSGLRRAANPNVDLPDWYILPGLRTAAVLVEMTPQVYDSEDLLQVLLAQYPSLLAGDQMNPGAPRRRSYKPS